MTMTDKRILKETAITTAAEEKPTDVSQTPTVTEESVAAGPVVAVIGGQVEVESGVASDTIYELKKTVLRLLALPTGATYTQRKAAIGEQIIALLGQEEISKLDSSSGGNKKTKSNKKAKGDAVSNGEKSVTAPALNARAVRVEEEEKVRQILREATTEEQLKMAIESARDLNMEFEVSLGKKKLEKICVS